MISRFEYRVVADDEEREYGNAAKALKNAETYRQLGLEVISTRNDFAVLFDEGVIKTPVR